ncbi:N-acetylmuramoyl-L-alanine amidase family protein, partial [uncultured Holdemanella sp.]|uniref:N-acetylmuramoyl-L-alanine amidase family protein n=1 Tax=uncultured Holdemanella sp. TaxID=1763549 RepID=UPI00345CBED0
MNKKDLSAVLLASVLGSAAFVAPVLAEETNTDPQEVETAPVEETTTVEQAETTTPVYINQFQTENGSTYYFDNNGNKVTGIQTIGSDVYYFDGNGVLQTSVEYEGYYFGVDGKAVKSDWVEFTNGYKYFDENGQVVKSTSTSPIMKAIDGNNYAFDLNGYMLTGWQEVDG